MKKLLSCVLILSLVLTSVLFAVACNTPEDPVNPDDPNTPNPPEEVVLTEDAVSELLTATETKMKETDDLAATLQLNVKTNSNGVTVEIPVSLALKLVDITGENPAMSFAMTGNVMGEEMNINACYKDGWAYVTQNGESYKQQADNPFDGLDLEMPEMPELDDETVALLESMEADLLKNANAVTKDGVTTIAYSLTLEDLMEVVSALMGSMGGDESGADEELGGMGGILGGAEMPEGMEMDGKLDLTMKIKDNFLTQLVLSLNAEMSMEGQTMTYEIGVTLDIADPAETVTVTLPEGAENFEEKTAVDAATTMGAAFEAMKTLDTYGMSMDFHYTMTTGGTPSEMSQWVYIDVENDGDAENTVLGMESGRRQGDVEQTQNRYYKDGWYYYVDAEGNGTKEEQQMSYSDGYTNAIAGLLVGADADLYADAEVSEMDGMIMMELEPTSEQRGYIPNIALEFERSFSAPAEISDLTVTVLIEDGYIISYQVTFTATGTSATNDATMTVEVEAYFTLYALGDDVVVMFPDGYEDFEVVNSAL